jgi:hypothetical protein
MNVINVAHSIACIFFPIRTDMARFGRVGDAADVLELHLLSAVEVVEATGAVRVQARLSESDQSLLPGALAPLDGMLT